MNNEQGIDKRRNSGCPVCGHTNPIGAIFCNWCGQFLKPMSQEKKTSSQCFPSTRPRSLTSEHNPSSEDMSSSQHVYSERVYFCASCGHQNVIGSPFCDYCGAVIKAGDWEVQVSGANALEVQTVAQSLTKNMHKKPPVSNLKKIVSVFLAANPATTSQLRLDEEIRAITEKIRVSEHRDTLELISLWATRPDDLLQALNQHHPHIVHFSGHGNSVGEIILVDNAGNPKPVTTQALTALFATLNSRFVHL